MNAMNKFEIDKLLWQRYFAKESGNFAVADEIRGTLKSIGVIVTDTKDGFTSNNELDLKVQNSWLVSEIARLNNENMHIKKVMKLREIDSHNLIDRYQSKMLNALYGNK
jgi:hypothetical protein